MTLSDKWLDMLQRSQMVGHPVDANLLLFVALLAQRVDELERRVNKYDEVEGRVEVIEEWWAKLPMDSDGDEAGG